MNRFLSILIPAIVVPLLFTFIISVSKTDQDNGLIQFLYFAVGLFFVVGYIILNHFWAKEKIRSYFIVAIAFFIDGVHLHHLMNSENGEQTLMIFCFCFSAMILAKEFHEEFDKHAYKVPFLLSFIILFFGAGMMVSSLVH